MPIFRDYDYGRTTIHYSDITGTGVVTGQHHAQAMKQVHVRLTSGAQIGAGTRINRHQ